MNRRIKVTITLPPTLFREARAYALTHGMSLNQLIIKALRVYVSSGIDEAT